MANFEKENNIVIMLRDRTPEEVEAEEDVKAVTIPKGNIAKPFINLWDNFLAFADQNEPQGFLGCDLGIVNILTDSDGEAYSGGQVNGLRKRHAKLRARLQSIRTRSAKKLLAKRRRKEGRFARDVNHCISKKVVAKAKRQLLGIALEDLKGISFFKLALCQFRKRA